jgi:hypothetical protein
MNTTSSIKIVLAVLLYLCLIDMPYGYYQFVRLSSFVIFGWLAFNAHKSSSALGTIIYIGLALLFQPIFKIALGRELWNAVDVVVGTGLIAGVLTSKLRVKN